MEMVGSPTRPNPWNLTVLRRCLTDTGLMPMVYKLPEMVGLLVELEPTCLKYPGQRSVEGAARRISDNLRSNGINMSEPPM